MLAPSTSRDDACGLAAMDSDHKLMLDHVAAVDNVAASSDEKTDVERALSVLEDDCSVGRLAKAKAHADVVRDQQWAAIQKRELNTAKKATSPRRTNRVAQRSDFLRPTTLQHCVSSIAEDLQTYSTTIRVNTLVNAHMVHCIKAAIEHVLAVEASNEQCSHFFVAPMVEERQARIRADTTVLMKRELQQLYGSLIKHDTSHSSRLRENERVLFWASRFSSDAAHDRLSICSSDLCCELFKEENRLSCNEFSLRLFAKTSQDLGKENLKCVAALSNTRDDDHYQSDGTFCRRLVHTRQTKILTATSGMEDKDRSKKYAGDVAQKEVAAILPKECKFTPLIVDVAKDIFLRSACRAATVSVPRFNVQEERRRIRHASEPGLKLYANYLRHSLTAIATMEEARQSPKRYRDRANAEAQLGKRCSLFEKGTAQEAAYARTIVQHMTMNVSAVNNIMNVVQLLMRGDGRGTMYMYVHKHFRQLETVAAHEAQRTRNVVQHDIVAFKGIDVVSHSLTRSICGADVHNQNLGKLKPAVRKPQLQFAMIKSNAVQQERPVPMIALQKELNNGKHKQGPRVVHDSIESESQSVSVDKREENNGYQQIRNKIRVVATTEKDCEAQLAEDCGIERLPLYKETFDDASRIIELRPMLILVDGESDQARRRCLVQAIECKLELDAERERKSRLLTQKRKMRVPYDQIDVTYAMQSIELSHIRSVPPIRTERIFFDFENSGQLHDRARKNRVFSNEILNEAHWTSAEMWDTWRTDRACVSTVEHLETPKQIEALLEAFKVAADPSRQKKLLTFAMTALENVKISNQIAWSDKSGYTECKPHSSGAKGAIEIEGINQLVECVPPFGIAALAPGLFEIVGDLEKLPTIILAKQGAIDKQVDRTKTVIKRVREIKRMHIRLHTPVIVGTQNVPKPICATMVEANVEPLQVHSPHKSTTTHATENHRRNTTIAHEVQLRSIGGEYVSILSGRLAVKEIKAGTSFIKRSPEPTSINAQLQGDTYEEDAGMMQEAIGAPDLKPAEPLFGGDALSAISSLHRGPLSQTTQFQEDDWELINGATSDEKVGGLTLNSVPSENDDQPQQHFCRALTRTETSQRIAQQTQPTASNWRPFRRIAQRIRRAFQQPSADMS